MARIPDQLDLSAPQGAAPSTAVVAPTDFGLGQAGAEAELVARGRRRVALLGIRAQAAQDKQTAATSPEFQAFSEADARGFAQDAGAWNGQPGFATDQTQKVQARLSDAVSAYAKSGATPSQVAEFRTLGLGQVVQRGAAANQWEQAQLLKQADQVRETAANGFVTQGIAAQSAGEQKLFDSYDGSSPTLVPQVSQAFDDAWGPVIAGAPAAMQPRLQLEASVRKNEAIAHAGAVQGHLQDAYVATQTGRQAETLINTVISNPLAYDDVARQLPAIASGLPGDLRDKTLQEWQGAAAKARIGALIDQQHFGQAISELDSGRYDTFLEKDEKGQLEARALAESRAHGPMAMDQAVARQRAGENMQADAYARATTGHGTGFDYDGAAASLVLTPEEAAKGKVTAQRSDQAFAAAGSVRDWSPTQLQAAVSAAPPDPAGLAPTAYTDKLFIWQTQRDAAAAEIKAREDPGAWAVAGGKVPRKGAPGSAAGQDAGALIQGKWQTYLQAPPATREAAGGDYARWMIGTQAASGIAPAQREIVPKAEADRLAGGVVGAPPEGKMAALSNIAGILSGLPTGIRTDDGSTVHPRQILIRQLADAKLPMQDIAAIVDSAGSAAKIGTYVAALNNPTLKGAAVGKDDTVLTAAVRSALAPYLATSTSPADEALNQGRLDYIALEARQLMDSQRLSAADAATRAAASVTGDYAFMHGWRMPATLAAQPVVARAPASAFGTEGVPSQMRGDQAANIGAATILAGLTAHGGIIRNAAGDIVAGVYAVAGVSGPLEKRVALHASQVMQSGQWKTMPDDSGLQLLVPQTDGTWKPVADRWGRPVRASWAELQGVAAGHPSPFAAPPPNQPKAPNGQPVPAFSAGQGFASTVWAITGQESRFKTGAEGPPTRFGRALGVMQVMPQFAGDYAQKLFGAPLDLHRLQWDDAYNTKIGSAMLADNIKRYGATGPGLALAIAAYNAGPGNVEGYTDARGYHPGILQTAGDPRRPNGPSLNDWIPRIGAGQADGVGLGQTRAYLQHVLPAALKRLQGGQ